MIIRNNHSDKDTEKMQRFVEYIESLEEEHRKIQVFQRELPLCLDLVSQAIETCRKELYIQGQSECSEQTSSEGPVFEEFIPIKRISHSEENEQQKNTVTSNNYSNCSDKSSKKSDWLKSVQLWNQTPDPPTKLQDSPRKVSVVEAKKNSDSGFHTFKREKSVGNDQPAPAAAAAAAASSTAETGGSSGGGGNKSEEKEDSQRKARRCWSPELHRRFLQALEQLGGAHVATPKQIRELMKVDGLTNDEVKSHLQKYRLHTRRHTSPSIHNPQAPQCVVVGGIWAPERASTVAKTTVGEAALIRSRPNEMYAPEGQKLQSSERGSHRDRRGSSNSLANSSSTNSTSVSPAI